MDILIRRAELNDATTIADIGRSAVELSHRASCSEKDMNHFLDGHYNEDAIKAELTDEGNIYHLVLCNQQPAGFSKIILNAVHPNIPYANATKLDRIYLDSKFYDQKIGFHLLQKNIQWSKEHDQSGIWLFTWQGNERAINFYKRNGFTIVGEHKFKVSETHYNPHYQMLLKY